MPKAKSLQAGEREELLATLRDRFEANPKRHPGIAWEDVEGRLEAAGGKLASLLLMERTGGEPDVVGRDRETGAYVFADCSKESPSGRRSLCYDRDALEKRKEHKPKDSAVAMAAAMGVDLMTEDDYRALQALGAFDNTTSSWIVTPPAVRGLGGALFGDRRYGQVFVYHNGADSYYAARGFRATLKI
jgi:hypothetical protein